MKRPLAYIAAPWGDNCRDDEETAARYCRQVYDAGYSPICPMLVLSKFLKDSIPQEHNLVVALPNGRPCEQTVITNSFNRLKKDAGLPNVVFHSLRHSSTTYKLKLNHGDLKATQGDTGHAQVDMITKIYAHILDEDRKINAQRFESAFYANPDLRSVHAPAEQQTSKINVQELIAQIQQSPELLAALSSLLVPKAN